MGDRANVVILEEDGGKIHLYTHWHGFKIEKMLARALDRGRNRWQDESYLARIVFCEMLRDDIDGTTGFGISTWHHEEGHDLYVDVKAQTVNDVPFNDFINKELE